MKPKSSPENPSTSQSPESSSVNQSAENPWRQLEQLKDGFRGKHNKPTPKANPETPQSKQKRIEKAKQLVQAAYKKGEQSRVDKIKADLNEYTIGDYMDQQDVAQPSTAKKLTRLIGDRLGLRSKKDEKLREREAISPALETYYAEEAQRKAQEARLKAQEEQRKAREVEQQRKAEQAAEQKALLEAMSRGHNASHYQKESRIQKQRIQEAIERDLNDKLLSIDDLEEAVFAEDGSVDKEMIAFEDAEIPIYNLKGLPFRLLSTTIDYRSPSAAGVRGTETFQKVMENPSVWNETSDQAQKHGDFGQSTANTRSNSISTSYRNSESIFDTYVPGSLIYGFDHVEADSIIDITAGDGGTAANTGNLEPSMRSLSTVDSLLDNQGSRQSYNYNEILLRRYSETGAPKKPDYLITENGNISKTALRHAKYFNIPIINIENDAYHQKMHQRGEAILNSINESDNYQDIDHKLAALYSMSDYKTLDSSSNYEIQDIGNGKIQHINPADQERTTQIRNLELNKRLNLIQDTLQNAIANHQDISSTFDFLKIEEKDFSTNKQLLNGEYFGTIQPQPGDCNSLTITFRLKNSPRVVKTVIYDGKHRINPNAARINPQELAKSESNTYDTFAPLIHQYLDTQIHKNGQGDRT